MKTFESFADASAFAKSLAQQGVAHNLRRNGSTWLVEHDQSNGVAQPRGVDIEPLLRKIDAKEKEIEALEKMIDSLEAANAALEEKYNALRASIQEQVSELTQKEKISLENEKQRLSEKIAQVEKEETALTAQKHKLELLEKEYAKCFGEAEVKVVKERVTSTEICPRCGGDGGVKGGCQKCDGTGWIDVTKENSKEMVEIK